MKEKTSFPATTIFKKYLKILENAESMKAA